MASTRAKPSIVIVKTSPRAAGLRPTAPMKDEKTLPMPIPAPITPIMAKPAPMSFAASISIGHFPFKVMFQFFDWLRKPVRAVSLVQVEGAVDVETGERQSVLWGKSVSVRVDLGGRGRIKKIQQQTTKNK